MSPLKCSFFYFSFLLGSFYCCCVYLCYTYSSIEATCPSIPAALCAFRLCFIGFVFVVRSCYVWLTKAEARARVGRPQTSSSPPVIFIAGRPKAALLCWFFGDFRCGALLFMVIHVIYKYKNR